MTKTERLLQLEVLLLCHPEWLRKADIAKRLGVERSTAGPQRLGETADSLDCRAFPRFTRAYREVLENLITASAERRTVRLLHSSQRRGETDEYKFQPYCLEPYPDGNPLHAIGFCPELKQMRTFKLERIRSVKPTDEQFQPPADFSIDKYTSAAWGIRGRAGRKPVPIMLRFSPSVAERVRETLWHKSQSLEECPDGSLLFRAVVAEPLEMYPWIRGWGADVEILEPSELRERFREEVGRLKKCMESAEPFPYLQHRNSIMSTRSRSPQKGAGGKGDSSWRKRRLFTLALSYKPCIGRACFPRLNWGLIEAN